MMKQGELLIYAGRIKRRVKGSSDDFEVVADLSPYDIEIALTTSMRGEAYRFEIYKEGGGFYTSAFDTSMKATTYTLEVSMVIEGVQVVAKNTSSVRIEPSVLGKNIGATLTQPTPDPSTSESGSVEAGEWEYVVELARSGSEASINTWSNGGEVETFAIGVILKGQDGTDGTNGVDGVNGVDGQDGLDGAKGEDGEDGASAYQIAVANGFEGTEAEWLESLKGSYNLFRNIPIYYFGSDTPTIPTDPVAELPDGWSLSNTITEESGVSQIVTTSTTLSMALYNEADSTYKFGDVFSIVSSGEGSSCCEMTQILDGDTSITLSDNTEYIFTTELEALSIDLPDDWGYCQARIKFATADSITTISISDDMMWSGGETPIIEANEQYELLISGNIVAIIGTGWALNNPEFIKMWNLRCNLAGQYNPISKKFELLNTTYSYDIDSKTFSTAIMELTQEEALDCWAQTAHLTPSAYALNRVTCKTNIPFAQARINRGGNDALDCHGASEGNTMSYIYFNPTTKNDTIYKQSGWHERSGISMFNTNAGGSVSSTVTEIIGILRMNFTSTQGTMHCGINCEKVWIYYTGTTGFTINSNCVNISRESMRFLFDNAAQTGDQTITIPQAVYDRLTEEDKEVAIDKGITLATN